MKLEWRDIPTYEGLYKVSNDGQVLSLNYKRTGRTQVLRPRKHTNGYHVVLLSKDGKVRNFFVHRLVMLAFVGDCPEGLEVAHLNGQPDDNWLENLAYVTQSENQSHRFLHGTSNHGHTWTRGEKNSSAKLSEGDVREIRSRLAKGDRVIDIARDYNVLRPQITKIKTGRAWGWLDSGVLEQ